MGIDLVECIPLDLAGAEDLGELLDALLETARGVDEWTERHAEVLDFIYRYRLLRLLVSRRPNDGLREDLLVLDRHLRQMMAGHQVAAMARLQRSYPDRWATLYDLAADRIEMIESDAPSRLLKRAHVQDILRRVHQGAFRTQADIADCGDFGGAPNVTRILNMMERNGLIERHKLGRENHLLLTPEGEQAVAKLNVERHGYGKKNYPVPTLVQGGVAEPTSPTQIHIDPSKLKRYEKWHLANEQWNKEESLTVPIAEPGASYFSPQQLAA